MRHLNAGRKLKRNKSHRQALFRNVVQSLFRYGQIITTVPKAKECAAKAEKMITLAKRAERKVVEMETKMKEAAKGNVTEEVQKQIEARAKAIRVNYLRRAMAFFYDKTVAYKLFNEIAPLFKNRNGGYTSIYRYNKTRVGDNAPLAMLRLVETIRKEETPKPKVKGQGKADAKPKQNKADVKEKQKRRKEREKEREKERKEKGK